MALVTWAIDTGRVEGPEVIVDVPSGRLRCTARRDGDGGAIRSVRFENVPSFALATDVSVPTSRGPLTLDVGFGGAFYGSLDVRALGLRVDRESLSELIALQRELRRPWRTRSPSSTRSNPSCAASTGGLLGSHRRRERLGAAERDGLRRRRGRSLRADRGRVAPGDHGRRGKIGIDEPFTHRSIVDSVFTAGIDGVTDVAGHPAVRTWWRIAYRTGEHTFLLDPRDQSIRLSPSMTDVAPSGLCSTLTDRHRRHHPDRGVSMIDFIIRTIVIAIGVAVVAYFYPSISYGDDLQTLALVAIILGLLNAFVKPVLKIFAVPLNMMTLGLFGVVINAALLIAVAFIADLVGFSFVVGGFHPTSASRPWSPPSSGRSGISIVATIVGMVVPD